MFKFQRACAELFRQKMTKKIRKTQTEPNASNTFRTQVHHEPYKLSRSVKQRHRWMIHFDKYRNARFTCRHFGISPDTFYLWKKRFNPNDIRSLEDDFKTRKPHSVRISKHEILHFEIIRQLKKLDPKLGRIKISKILEKVGYRISSSTVSRILKAVRD